jgi:DNA-directed RNA polymerase subunit H (RpoH/RPB5)
LLSESEAKKIAKEFSITLDKFPKILESDPQIQKLGAKSGRLIQINRNDDGKKYVAYRYVIKG